MRKIEISYTYIEYIFRENDTFFYNAKKFTHAEYGAHRSNNKLTRSERLQIALLLLFFFDPDTLT